MARPQRIVLVRHGESEGNADDTVYEREPDHALRLTATGLRQARETGAQLRELFGRERVSVYVSPYRRTHETFRAFGLDLERVRVREEPRLREQDWGNWQDREDVRLQKAYRDAYGHFFYRFAQGSPAPMCTTGSEHFWRACTGASKPPTIRPTFCWSPMD